MNLAERYAKALYQLAADMNMEDIVLYDSHTVCKVIQTSDELFSVMKNPVVHSDKKIKISEKIFKGRVSDLSLKFIKLVIHKNRSLYLVPIFKSYEKVYKSSKNITDVFITCAFPLSEEEKKKIEFRIKNKLRSDIEFHYSIDEKLIGGFIVRYSSYLLDYSFKGMLNKIKKNFELTDINVN